MLLCAALVYELSSQTRDIISVVYNSAALLCVLEFYNCFGAMITERRVSRLHGDPSNAFELSEIPPEPRHPAAAAVGYAYISLLCALALAEVYAAVMPLSQAKPMLFTLTFEPRLNGFRNTGPACIAFGVVYTTAVAVLFDAPLPLAKSCAWSVCTKLALVAIAAAGVASRSGALRVYLESAFDCLLLAFWLALYAIWPWARSCDRARRASAIPD